MGGYAYSIALADKPKEAAAVAAGRALWEWFFFETRDLKGTPIGERVHEYVEMYSPLDRISFRDGVLTVGLGDAGGTGYHTMLATMHVFTRLLDAQPEIVQVVLERHGLALATNQERDEYIREQRFLFFDNAVAQIWEGSVSRDSNGEDDGAEVSIDSLPAAVKKRVEAFVNGDSCECPICATTSTEVARPANAAKPAKAAKPTKLTTKAPAKPTKLTTKAPTKTTKATKKASKGRA